MRTKRRPSGDCPKCGTWRFSLHRDHIVPKWKGGSEDESNIQYICANCHEDKTRDDLRGQTRSEECRQRISTAVKAGMNVPAVRDRLSALRRGRKPSEAARRNMSASHVGFRHSSESIEKMRASHRTPEMQLKKSVQATGRAHSEGTRKQMRESALKAWARRKGVAA